MAQNTSEDFQDVFARLRSSASRSQSAQNASPSPSYQSYPFASSPQARPSENLSNRAGDSNPNTFSLKSATPVSVSADQSSANLLSMLKFNQPSLSTSPRSQQKSSAPGPYLGQLSASTNQTSHGRGVSTSDLLGTFLGKASTPSTQDYATPESSVAKTGAEKIPTANPQDFLLQLLNRPKPVQASSVSNVTPPPAQNNMENLSRSHADISVPKDYKSKASDRESTGNDSPIRVFGGEQSRETTPFELKDMPKIPQSAPNPASKESLFTYVNPFEQLAASSPRNAISRSGNATPGKETSQAAQAATNGKEHARMSEDSVAGNAPKRLRKLTPGGHNILQSIESAEPNPDSDDHKRSDGLTGLGAPTTDAETVAQALNEVGAQVSKQVEHALAEADENDKQTKVKKEELEDAAVAQSLQNIAIEVKEELKGEGNKEVLEDLIPGSWSQNVEQVITEAANGNVSGTQGETKAVKGETSLRAIPVYNFPMRPFVSIHLKQDAASTTHFREDAIAEIARFKKDFDQIDRTLVTASHEFIAYALPKTGGVRIIRQDDGADRKYFKETHDRVFNVAISSAPPGKAYQKLQSFIATAVSGSVYWAAISHMGEDNIQKDDNENRGLAFPPIPAHDEHTSGGQLKTRAKKSNRHPEFFAIGRGKAIQIVFPLHAQSSDLVNSNSVVDTEKYFKDRSLKVNTGKAGKDFSFSEDDSVIATLDKAGRLRIWDIRDLTNESNGVASKISTTEVNAPLLSFTTTSPTEKSWPTSVTFVDKSRAYTRGIALRYVIVGLKQNHTIQLWDLGLGKAVQELNFPHDKESDAICSVCYHAPSGIVVVGHPTRNSIYFVHLSAPKYNLSSMSQAKYAQRLATKDPSLPKPDATAIMSGVREYVFSSKDQLRSVDLLPSKEHDKTSENIEDQTLFELYAMHSKGVACINIKKGDLGWTQENKIINPVDAEAIGIVQVKDLRDIQTGAVSELSSVGDDVVPNPAASATVLPKEFLREPSKKANKSTADGKLKNSADIADFPAQGEKLVLGNPLDISVEPLGKKKKNRSRGYIAEVPSIVPPQAPLPPAASYASAAQRGIEPVAPQSIVSSRETNLPVLPRSSLAGNTESVSSTKEHKSKRAVASAESFSLGVSGDFLDKELKKIENSVSGEFSRVLGKELGDIYRRFDEDKRVQDAAGAAKQDAILRLVSSTLTDNVDKALSRIISANIQQFVVPSITDVTASTLNSKVPEWLTQNLLKTLPPLLKLALPEAISQAVMTPDVLRVLSDQLTLKVTSQVEQQFSKMLLQTVVPAFQSLAVSTAHKLSSETERRVAEQLNRAEVQHRDDAMKIDQLSTLVRGLSETVHAMAAAQSQFQSEILKLQQQSHQQLQPDPARPVSRSRATTPFANSDVPEQRGSEQRELNTITALMRERKFEEATIKWLQGQQQGDYFDKLFVNWNPEYLRECQPLVVLSVGAAVSANLETNVAERLQWIETVLKLTDLRDPEIGEVGPRILEVLGQRLEARFMVLCELDNRGPFLNQFPPITRRIRQILATLGHS